MKIIEPRVELMRDFDGAEVMKFIERCGRTCYQSEKFVRNLIKRGHESVLEHFSATFKIICRHNGGTYTSPLGQFQRFNAYKELTFIKPCFWSFGSKDVNSALCYNMWADSVKKLEMIYKTMREKGATPEQARSILPNSLKTEILMTANLREWRTILKLRTAKDAHPQMRQVATMILAILKEKLPVVFEDIGV